LTDDEFFKANDDDDMDIAAPPQAEGFEKLTLSFVVSERGKKRRTD
jgi:hypothetical protein